MYSGSHDPRNCSFISVRRPIHLEKARIMRRVDKVGLRQVFSGR
jgi:hypothetical protein